jgi:hypothetical protein
LLLDRSFCRLGFPGWQLPDAIEDIEALENQKRNLQASNAKLPKDQQVAGLEKIAAMNKKSKELQASLVPPPGDMPVHDQAGFYWKEMIGFIHKVLADPKSHHPEYDPQAGFEVAIWRMKKDAFACGRDGRRRCFTRALPSGVWPGCCVD